MGAAASGGKVLSVLQSVAHMRTVNSAAMPDRENGMARQRAYRAAAGGKRPSNNRTANQATRTLMVLKRLIFAVATLFVASVSGSASYAQSGPFAGMAGHWAGGGTVFLDDRSSERLTCPAASALCARGTRTHHSPRTSTDIP